MREGAAFAVVARYALAHIDGVPALAAVATGILANPSPVIRREAVDTTLRELQEGQGQ